MGRYITKAMALALLGGVLVCGCGIGGGKESVVRPESTEDDIEQEFPETGEEEGAEAERLRFIDAWGEWHDMKVDPDVEKHSYDWSCLTNTEEGIFYTGDDRYDMRRGVDVSEHQGSVDWERVKAAGYEFVILRIGYRGYGTAGNLYVDAMFHENIAGAKAAGLDVGVYIFSQAVNEQETLEEAELVLENLKGYRPMVYSNLVWEAFEFDMEKLADYPIWYADYEPAPQTPYRFTFWQYSEKGQVDGIEGGVDLNVQFCEKG